MKTFSLKFSAFTCALVLLFTAFSSSSCKKDKTCHGKVTVVDTTGKPIGDAKVNLSANTATVTGDVTYDEVTDGSGVAEFEVKLPAIFDVKATKSSLPGRVGTGILRVDEPGKTGEVTVTMK
jgi:hypothetical protein